LTSWEARENLKEAGCTPDQIKEKEDETAAQIILQSYLNENGS
jgi:RNase H-fold protein (predicted Holliday junction resolvase)